MATKKRLIDSRWLTSQFYQICEACQTENIFIDAIIDEIDNAPEVDAVEVVHGHWISDEGDVLFHCSECETQISTSWDYDDLIWNYCPNCGAKMDGDGNG